jgi:bifunctional non-homologous end joining protein LigD
MGGERSGAARPVSGLFDFLPAEARALLVPSALPEWVQPMLATLTERRFSDPEWIFERKLDGERCLAFVSRAGTRLLSRNRLDASGHYPEIVEALGTQAGEFVVDGEVVAFRGGRTSFELLQRRMQVRDPSVARRTGVRVFYYVFDVVHADGFDTTKLELRHRKALLRRLLRFEGPIRFTAHRRGNGEAFWHQACEKGWEGVIAKRAACPYVPRRSPDWLKFKCVNEQELLIGGYTDPKGGRKWFGALLLGYHEGDELRYAGKVGTGFDDRLLADLYRRLKAIERATPPYAAAHLPRKGIHWVEPKLVAQVGFSEWTRGGQLRHPRFLGLREDKTAREVVRERPQA